MGSFALNMEPGTVHLLPKKPGQKGRIQVHCLEDACIMVRVPSGTLSEQAVESLPASDTSLNEYAEKSAASREKSATSEINAHLNDLREDELDGEPEDDEAAGQSKENLAFSDFEDCTQFLDPVAFAKELVTTVVADSEDRVEVQEETRQPNVEDQKEHRLTGIMEGFRESMEFYVEKTESTVSWPTIGEFTVQLGAFTIDEYLSSFDTEEDWMYVIYYEGMNDMQVTELHQYQAIYSLPTWKYPIAQATASVFFTIELCQSKPPHCLVDVTYRYETFRQVHRPGYLDFQEKWLHYILDAKIKLFQTVTY